ncbi:MAG: hypothetical protein HY314_16640 [Acidobacteria bacterium]|nr:hypothetical protein [Acidobacteriota bacterium]
MSLPLKNFLERLLARHDALVEDIGEDALEVLFPPELAERLNVGEWERFYFPDASKRGASAMPMSGLGQSPTRIVSYQSELLETLGELVARRGAMAVAALAEPPPVKRLELERDIERAIVLQNAVIRGQQHEQAIVPYLVFHFKYTALSDERHEGMVSLAINERTVGVVQGLSELIPQVTLSPKLPVKAPVAGFEPMYARARRAAQSLIREALADFVKSMNRRLNRDVQHVTEYYRTIQQEIEMKIKKKGLAGEELEREQSRIRATEIELERKVSDLQAKYDLKVQVEAVALLRLLLPVMLLRLNVMRRKWIVPIELAWNPLLRQLERVTCLGCFRPSKSIFICDDQRHSICPECFKPCFTCQRPCCRACAPRGCPRCEKIT